MHDFERWDPLQQPTDLDEGFLNAILRQRIKNVLKSYTGSFDLFAELIQNALDAVELRAENEDDSYQPTIWIHIDIPGNKVTVSDNGIGITEHELKYFLQPSLTFKRDECKRGNKGVGATYLAYGFNSLQVATRIPSSTDGGEFEYIGLLRSGRTWVEDTEGLVDRPQMVRSIIDDSKHPFTSSIDRGTSFTVGLGGRYVRQSLTYYTPQREEATITRAEQWAVLLRIKTPLGGIYLFNVPPVNVTTHITVVDELEGESSTTIDSLEYYYPHMIDGKHATLTQLHEWQTQQTANHAPITTLPPELSNLHGIYETFSADDLLEDRKGMNVRLTPEQIELINEYTPQVYVFFAFSTRHWDGFDRDLQLRKRTRILDGGIQLATQNMVQGDLIEIPLTSSIGYQRTTHAIVHFDNADPDLGRKGFQPELKALAERIASHSVTVFKRWVDQLVRDSGGGYEDATDQKQDWIFEQRSRAQENPLIINNAKRFFHPALQLPTIVRPDHAEQDVIALFNQMLAMGIIRGIHILGTHSHKKYDGIFRFTVEHKPEFIYDPDNNPLGVPPASLTETQTRERILEYKFNVDGLINDFRTERKFPSHIDLIVAWSMGEDWMENYQVMPLLHEDYLHDRRFHGITHLVTTQSQGHQMYAIILDELIDYLNDPDGMQAVLEERYINV